MSVAASVIVLELGAAKDIPPEVQKFIEHLENDVFDANQREMLRFIREQIQRGERLIVIKASRQLGKSLFLVGLAIMLALLVPGAQIKYACPSGKMARTIIRPHFRQLTTRLAAALWEFHNQQGEYVFLHRGGMESVITIGGCDAGNVESLRGQHAHIVIVDEAGFIADLRYAIDDVLMPQTINTRGVVILSSTPAKTPGHPFFRYCLEAQRDGRIIIRTIYDNPRLGPDDIKPLIKTARGEKSTTWRREYLVEDVVDAQTAAVPNATTAKLLEMMYAERERPQAYEPYTSIAVGFGLKTTGILYAYVDRSAGKDLLVVEAEDEIRGMDTGQLTEIVTNRERGLWTAEPKWRDGPFRRVASFSPTLMGQVQNEHKLRCTPPVPVDLVETMNSTRLRVEGTEIRIQNDCESLLRQVQNAVWKPNMKEFEESDEDDNYALVHSLGQLVRNVRMGQSSTGQAGKMRALLSGRR